MSESLRIATFNVENLDNRPDQSPSLTERIAIMRPQLTRLRADVICFQEVNGQETPNQPRSVLALKQMIQGTQYETYHLAHTLSSNNEAYDERNLVVLSRFPITSTQQLKHTLVSNPNYRYITALPAEQTPRSITWERPIYYVTLNLGDNRTLHLINLHLKSKIPSTVSGQKINNFTWRSVSGWAEGYFVSSLKRVGQALEVRVLIDQIFDNEIDSFIAVCGDFNADSDSVPVNTIRGPVEETGNPALSKRIMIPCEATVPEPSRYSLLHLGKGELLDHLLVSRQLLAFYRGTAIHNEVLPDESGAFRTDEKFPESDHAPVVAEFVLP